MDKGGQMRRNSQHRLLRAAWVAGPLSVMLVFAAVLWSALPSPATATLSASQTASPFAGTPAVGALFTINNGRLGTHFCTASVVHSPQGDLILTAAHCLAGYSDSSAASIAFVPGYVDGATPEGVWPVTRIFVDREWEATADPDDDFAFLTVAQPGSTTPIEYVTGAEHLGIDETTTAVTRVVGYPDTLAQPIVCQNRTSMFSATQMRFDCDGFTMGTSGSPFLIDSGGPDGGVTVAGVIGGYEQGGDSPNISYAAALGANAQALYNVAIAAS
jgi:V8-like Glu-specific endopeptidase